MNFKLDRGATELFIVLLLSLLPHLNGQAQETGSLELRLVRRFGFQSGLRIQGSFSTHVRGPETLERVDFLLDNELVFTDEEAPFRMAFSTNESGQGEHRFWAVGFTQEGERIESSARRLIFVTADDGWGMAVSYLVPVFILIAAVSLIAALATMRSGKRNRYQLGEYGTAGGAVCGRCGLPFARHFFSPNLLFGKLERCPHCGRWGIVPRATAAVLDEAEARYAADSVKGSYQLPRSDDDLLARIEDSRYED